MKATIRVLRFDPGEESGPCYDTYQVEVEERTTVLGALQQIYEQLDPSLAIEYGCRFKRCGLCAMKINGVARMACLTQAKEEMTIEPLAHVAVKKDLVVDRTWVLDMMRHHRLYVDGETTGTAGEFATLETPPEFEILSGCTECMCCVSGDPTVDQARPEDGGALMFVKLAYLHFHPRDSVDRLTQARALGVERYRNLKNIGCPYGIALNRVVFAPLLGEGSRTIRRTGERVVNEEE